MQSSSNALTLKLQRSRPVILSEALADVVVVLVAVLVAVVAVVVDVVALMFPIVVALTVTPEPERPDPPFWAKRTRVEKNMAKVTTMHISAFFTLLF